MNKSVLLVLIAGGMVALLTALLMQSLFGRAPEPALAQDTPPPIEMVELLVAAGDLSKGSAIRSMDVEWVEWPKQAVFQGAITRATGDADTAKPEGRLRRDVADGEPLTHSVFVSSTNHNFIAVSLPEGQRAMALNVNAGSSVGGFVMPGDYIDIIMTYEVRLPADEDIRHAAQSVIGRTAAETVLRNVQVMAVDQDIDTDEEPKLARTVTVAVDERGAEILALATAMGELSVALRGLGDGVQTAEQEDSNPVMTDRRLSGVMRELFDGQNNTGLKLRNVRIYHGSHSGAFTVPSSL